MPAMPVEGPAAEAGPRVSRGRLLSALDEPSTVIVLRAPAGFGKTTLLRQWSEVRPGVVRLPTDDGSAPETSLWPRISAALTIAGYCAPDEIGHGPYRADVMRLLASAGPITLVLDEVDTIAAQIPDELVLGLLRSCPELRLIFAGRGGSWLPDDLLSRIGARVIGPDELLFTREEIADLLGRTVPSLNHQTPYWAEQVHRSTGGWPEITAAVAHRMAAVGPGPIELAAIAERAAAGYLRSRLVPELERLDGTGLASATAVADRFSAELARAVTGRSDTAAGLDRLVAGGLLIRDTVGNQAVYRWPAAARAVLVEELTVRDPQETVRLHTSWANQCLAHDQPGEAVLHARAAQNWPLFVTIIETAWRALLRQDSRALRDALAAMPPEAVAGSVRARALREIVLFSPGMPSALSVQPVSALAAVPAAAANLARLATAAQLAEVLDSGLLVIAAHRHRGRHIAALEDARRLLEVADLAHLHRPADVAPYRPAVQLAVGVGLLLTSDIQAALGTLELAYQHAVATSGSPGQFSATGAASLLAMSYAVLGDVTTARRWRDRIGMIDATQAGSSRPVTHLHVASAVADLLIAVDEADADAADAANHRLTLLDPASPWLDLWAFTCYAQAQYALHRGDVHAALDRIYRARATHRHDLGDDGIATQLLSAAEANLLIAAGRANQARRCLRLAGRHGMLRVPAARLALLSGDTAEAARLAADTAWESMAGTRDRIEMRLIRAIAAHRAGDLPLAQAVLDRAVRAAQSTGLRSAWATVPGAELNALGHHGVIAGRSRRPPLVIPATGIYPDSVVIIELTDRERDVLDRLAAGATLERIATTLTISYNTVKTHAASIYRKLRVESREAAVGEAQRLGLLDPPRP